jgi:hypothetical protein
VTDPSIELFLDVAEAFADLTARLPADLAGPGLGEWDLRALVGHTSRAVLTVTTYLDQPREAVEVPSAAAYFLATGSGPSDSAAVTERAVQAGVALGEDPAGAVRRAVEDVADRLSGVDPDAVITTVAGAMRVRDYLPTRTFELVVHGLDIVGATGVDWAPPADAVSAAARLATEIALARHQGAALLRCLTGRGDPISIFG